MAQGAPRLLLRLWSGSARGAFLMWCVWQVLLVPVSAAAQEIEAARFVGPTQHYAHGVLGDTVEYSGMMIELSHGASFLVGFSEGGRVFEDIAPRLWDVTGDGNPEIVVIETDPPLGAQLSIYGMQNGVVAKLAATPHIGQTHRWLAPIGAADLDGDGHIEIAYIDRPHLAKTLHIWRYQDGTLRKVATKKGLTNHKIGWDFIVGGIRQCDGRPPELITASGDWSRVVSTRFRSGNLASATLDTYSGPGSVNDALICP